MTKYALITGCSEGGIGDAIAIEFHKKGIEVIATARDPTKMEHLKVMGFHTVKLDVVSQESIDAAVKEVEKITGGRLDFLVNNSGLGYMMPMLDVDMNRAKALFDVNVFALITVTKAFSPLLIAAAGKLITIGSIAGVLNRPFQGVYNMSKAAANLFSDQMRIELAPFGVQVINVTAGVIQTKWFGKYTDVLPVDTSYSAVKDQVEQEMKDEYQAATGSDRFKFAATVVAKALKSSSPSVLWTGSNALLVWVCKTFLWHTHTDFVFWRLSVGLRDLANIVRNSKKLN